MKLSLVPLLLVAFVLCFLLVLLWFQSSAHFQQDGDHKYYKPKPSFRKEHVVAIETQPVLPNKTMDIIPIKALDEVVSPTSPPVPDELEQPPALPDEKDSLAKYISSIDAKPPVIPLQDAYVNKQPQPEYAPAAVIEAKLPTLVVPESLHNSLYAALAEPVTMSAAAATPEPTLPSAYRSSIVVEEHIDGASSVFRNLREAHINSLEAALLSAREAGDVITAETASLESASSAGDMVEKSFEFRALTRVHRALKTGATCVASTTAGGPYLDNTLYTSIQTLMDPKESSKDSTDAGAVVRRPKSIIEYSPHSADVSNTVAFALSGAYPTVTVLLLQFGDSSSTSDAQSLFRRSRSLNPFAKVCDAERPGSNMYIAQGEENALDHQPLVMDCIQVLSDLTLLVNNLLPFEYEEALGNILCRCNATYLPITLPEDAYFAFWDSASHLLHSVEAVASETCSFSFDLNSNANRAASAVRSSHIIVQRNSTLPAQNTADSTSTSSTSSSRASSSSNPTSVAPLSIEAAAQLEKSLAASYLTVGQLSSLSLDVHSRHHLWSAVSSYLSTRRGKDFLRNANHTAHDLVVHGSTARTAVDIATEKAGKGARSLELRNLETSSPATAVSDTHSVQGHRSTLSKGESHSAGAGAVVGGQATSLNVSSSAPDSELLKLSHEAAALIAAPANNGSAPLRRRRLYVINKSSSNSGSARAGSGGGSAVPADVFPEEAEDLTWEYPDHAHSVSGGAEEFDETDYAIKNQFLALSEAENGDLSSSSWFNNRNSKKYSLSTASRDLQRHLHLREASSYRRWMLALKTPMEPGVEKDTGLNRISSAGLVYVMGRQVSLLSLKLSKMLAPQRTSAQHHPGGLLVSLLSDSLSYKSHSLLATMMALKNNIICRPTWNSATLAALLASPERASLSVIQADVVVEIIVSVLSGVKGNAVGADLAQDLSRTCKAGLLEESFAALLTMSEVSYIEVPSLAVFTELLEHSELPDGCLAYLLDRYTPPAALLELSVKQLKLGASTSIDEVFAPSAEVPAEVRIYRVHVQHNVGVDSHTDGGGALGYKFTRKSTHVGLSLYSALHLRIIDPQKKVLLKMMIDFPLWKFKPSMDVAPWELFIMLTASKGSIGSRTDWSLFYSSTEQHSLAEHAGASKQHGGFDAVSRNHAHYTSDLRTDNADFTVGVSLRPGSPQSDRIQGRAVWKALDYELTSHSAEVAQGKFSFVEHDSGFGYVSLRVAKGYPNATVISIERSPSKVSHHVSMVKSLFVDNNAVCQKTEADAVIYKNIYESPELFRFQLLSRSMLDGFVEAESLSEWGAMVGTMLSAALTTFIYAPHSAQVSWAMHVLFSEVYEFMPAPVHGSTDQTAAAGFRRYSMSAPVRPLSDVFGGTVSVSHNLDLVTQLNTLGHHPQFPYRDFEKQWVLENARVNGGNTAVQLSPLAARDKLSDYSKDKLLGGFNIPLVRCDIVNMTRHVHHHYDYSKDGHSRTYTMRIKVNQTLGDTVMSSIGDPSHTSTHANSNGIVLRTITHNSIYSNRDTESAAEVPQDGLQLPLGYHPNQHSVVGVHLLRDRDSFPIPYTNIYGVTLISALRLGLEHTLRDRMFKSFLKMPLYEDMAPWNVVLMGQVSLLLLFVNGVNSNCVCGVCGSFRLIIPVDINFVYSIFLFIRRAWTISTTTHERSRSTRSSPKHTR